MSPYSIDLFAGCGGLSLGLHQAGWEGLFAVERDPMAFETLQRNMIDPGAPYLGYRDWPDWIPRAATDIDALLSDERIRRKLRTLRGSVGLLAGGPPCQGFSIGGARDGDDQRNKLVSRWLDFVDLVRPSAALVENVEGITRRFVSKPGGTATAPAEHIVESLKKLGYDAAYTVVDASRFGVPQIRRRVIILGISESIARAGDLATALEAVRTSCLQDLGLPVDRAVTAWDALHDLDSDERVICVDSPKFTAGTYRKPRSAYARLMRTGVASDVYPNSHRMTHHGDRILQLYETAHATQAPGRLSKAFLLSQGTKKDKKVLLDPHSPSSTITTHPDEFIHYREPRNITVREMARLQSFPDRFDFYGRYTINGPRRRFDVARCSQVGNAVPPLLGRAIGLAIRELIGASQSAHIADDEAMGTKERLAA